MEKAWDLKALGEKAKAKLLPIAALLAGDIIDWTADSLALNQNMYVKIIGGVVRSTKEPIMAEIKKSVEGAQLMASAQMQDVGQDFAAVQHEQAVNPNLQATT